MLVSSLALLVREEPRQVLRIDVVLLQNELVAVAVVDVVDVVEVVDVVVVVSGKTVSNRSSNKSNRPEMS